MDGRRNETIRQAWREIADPVWQTCDALARPRLGPNYSTPRKQRRTLEAAFLAGREMLNPRSPRDRVTLAKSFRQFILAYLLALTQAVQYWRSEAIRLPKPKAEGEPPAPKALANGLELASFVVEHALPVSGLLRGELRSGLQGPYGLPWPTLSKAWKQSHSDRRAYSRDVLRVMYSHAVRNTHVARELLAWVERSLTGRLTTLLRLIREADSPRSSALAKAVKAELGDLPLATLRELTQHAADYARLHHEHQDRTRHLTRPKARTRRR